MVEKLNLYSEDRIQRIQQLFDRIQCFDSQLLLEKMNNFQHLRAYWTERYGEKTADNLIKTLTVGYTTGDFGVYYRVIEPLAEKGDAFAQALMAEAYLDGVDVPKNLQKALVYARNAAEAGVEDGDYVLIALGQPLPMRQSILIPSTIGFHFKAPATLVRYDGMLKDLLINKGIRRIEDRAFFGNKIIEAIQFDGTTEIGDGAFYGCSKLWSVNMCDGVRTVGAYAFAGCASLAAVHIPSTVSSIGEGAFIGCESLNSVERHNGSHAYGWRAFFQTPWAVRHCPHCGSGRKRFSRRCPDCGRRYDQ